MQIRTTVQPPIYSFACISVVGIGRMVTMLLVVMVKMMPTLAQSRQSRIAFVAVYVGDPPVTDSTTQEGNIIGSTRKWTTGATQRFHVRPDPCVAANMLLEGTPSGPMCKDYL